MDSATLALVNDMLTGTYVLLTLIIAGAAIWSIQVSSRQSQEAKAASWQQSKEALHNQYKPIIIPGDRPISLDEVTYKVNIKNLGAGVALNVWGVFTTMEQSVIRCTERIHVLGQNSEEVFPFNTNGASLYTHSEFEGYPVFVQSNGNSNFSPEMHLMITYTDTFNNNYLVDFDYNDNLGWRQWTAPKRIEKRLDQLTVKRGFVLPHQLGEK